MLPEKVTDDTDTTPDAGRDGPLPVLLLTRL